MDDVSLPELVVLTLVAEGSPHGFAVARVLAPDGEVGIVYGVARSAVYRAVERLAAAGLLESAGTEQGDRGPVRTRLRATERGRAVSERWLAEPVAHVRDLRTGFLVKLALLERAGGDRARLVSAQRAVLVPIVRALEAPAAGVPGDDGIAAVVRLWRRSSAQSALQFLDALDALDAGRAASP